MTSDCARCLGRGYLIRGKRSSSNGGSTTISCPSCADSIPPLPASPSDLPALAELARRVTIEEIEHRRDVANSRAEEDEGSPEYSFRCQERDFWFDVSALVALATGGAADTAKLERDRNVYRWALEIQTTARAARNMWRNPTVTPEYRDDALDQIMDRLGAEGEKLHAALMSPQPSLTPERPADEADNG